jgi:hypothetical protein
MHEANLEEICCHEKCFNFSDMRRNMQVWQLRRGFCDNKVKIIFLHRNNTLLIEVM